jgi:serine/threonine protein kinase
MSRLTKLSKPSIYPVVDNFDKPYPILPSGYLLLKKLGQGGYGSVYLCQDTKTGREYAVKQLEISEKGIPFLMEANVMTIFTHPHLAHAEKIVADDKNLLIFQEKAKCDLAYLVRKKQQLPSLHQLRDWSFGLVQALACLHQQGIVHGDVKASNILLFEGDNIRLSDFNLAQKLWSETKLSYRACTCTHRPLEVWLEKDWDLSVDIWSLGCTLFEIAYGTHLFPYQGWEDNPDKDTLKERFLACLDDFAKKGPGGPQEIPYHFKRPRVTYLSYHLPTSFYNPDYALFNTFLLSMLRFDPTERPGIIELLQHPYFHGLVPIDYKTTTGTQEILPRKKEEYYLGELGKFSLNPIVIEVSMSVLRMIQNLKFRDPNFEDERLRLLGAYWIGHKLVLRRHPSLPYPTRLLFRLERRICEYLSYCLLI